ncbi:MAG: hypothetical protein KF724_05960 [Phycisphaeraceae bacterium]|nr:hypothetical protein [Phycisphaeraceae bacterium]
MIEKVVFKGSLQIARWRSAICSTGSPGLPPSAWPRSNDFAGTSMDIYPDFRDPLTLFNAHRVEYVIVGGYAVGHHGAMSATADVEAIDRGTGDG